jgi:hypothetical protein
MSFHGLGAQVQEYGHFLGTPSFSEKLSDFPFARGESRQVWRLIPGCGMSLLQEARQYQIVDSWGEKHSLALQGFDRGHQIASGVGFEHEAACPGIEGLTDDLIGIRDGQNYDLELGVMLHQLACGVQSVEEWHAYVHDHDIRLQLLGHLQRLTAIGCLSAHFPSLVSLEKRAQPSAHDFVIVG